MKTRFNVGDKVVLIDYETMCEHRRVSPNNEVFQRHYNYIKSKEPLVIHKIFEPGDLLYGSEDPIASRRGLKTREVYYNIITPRSRWYLFDEDEFLEYIEPEEEPSQVD